MRLITVTLAAVAACSSCAARAELRSFHLQRTMAAFSPAQKPRSRISQHNDVSRIRHADSYKARQTVACNAAMLEPVIASTSLVQRILSHGVKTFMSNWKAYAVIPFIAGFVGWFTNYLAVQMIFYPIRWRGLPIYKVEGEPLGLLGCVSWLLGCCCVCRQ